MNISAHARKSPEFALLLLLVAPVLFASNMLMARWVDGSIPPFALTFWRWLLTLPVLLALAGTDIWRHRYALRREWTTILVLGALGMGVCGAPVYLAGQSTSATNIGLIYTASPMLVMVFARVFWGEPITARALLGITVSAAGVDAVVAKGEWRVLAELAVAPGDLWIGLAMAGWALYSVLLKYRPSQLDLTQRFAAIAMAGVLVNAPFYAVEHVADRALVWDGPTLGIMAFVALVPGIGAFLTYGRLVVIAGPRSASLIMYLTPLYNAVLAWILLGETIQAFHAVGAALILPGVFLATATGASADRRGA